MIILSAQLHLIYLLPEQIPEACCHTLIMMFHHLINQKHVSELIYGYLLELVPLFFLSSTLLKNGQEEKDREDTITEEDADYNKQRIRS